MAAADGGQVAATTASLDAYAERSQAGYLGVMMSPNGSTSGHHACQEIGSRERLPRRDGQWPTRWDDRHAHRVSPTESARSAYPELHNLRAVDEEVFVESDGWRPE